MNSSQQLALVTGASSGIGAAYARYLANKGYDLILTARREERLKTLAADIAQSTGRRVRVEAADLARHDDVTALVERIKDERITMLVNNAGFGTTGRYAEVDLQKQLDMVHVHINATMILTHALLPAMIASGVGTIVNVSSIAAWLPAESNVTYSATKAYLNTFSQALAVELKGSGVKVQSICPGFTYTEFHDTDEYTAFERNSVPSHLWMSAESLVAYAMAALKQDKVIVVPGLRNKLITGAFRIKPLGDLARFIRTRILRRGERR